MRSSPTGYTSPHTASPRRAGAEIRDAVRCGPGRRSEGCRAPVESAERGDYPVGEAEAGPCGAGGGSRSCGRAGRRVRLSCERSGLRDAAREGEACGRATSARYNVDSRARHNHIRGQRDRVYYSLYSRRAPSPRTGVLFCRLVAAAIGATTAFHAMRIHTPRLVARARPHISATASRDSQSLLWRVHQPPAAMRIPNDSSHDEFLPT